MAIHPLVEGDPKRLGGYELQGRLGEGGHGVVYLARRKGRAAGGSRHGQELVAVKRLRPELAANPEFRTRFAREAAAAKQVMGGHTAKVLEAEVSGDRPYIVSEYIEGPTLQQLVADKGPRPESGLLSLAFGTATALTAIHRAGIVHRDFKPNNVVMSPDGPRVIDFGVARSLDATTTLTSHLVGTPAYMAPEQIKGEDVTPKTDVFAWAATIVFAASGRPPFGAANREAMFYRLLHGEPDLAELPAALRDLVAACLAKNPHARPATPDLLSHLLGGAEATAPVERTLAGEAAAAAAAVAGEPVVTVKDILPAADERGPTSPVDLLPSLPSAPRTAKDEDARQSPPAKRPDADPEPESGGNIPAIVGVAITALALAGLITAVGILFRVNDAHGLEALPTTGDKPQVVDGQGGTCVSSACAPSSPSALRYTLATGRSIATEFQIPGDKTRFFDTSLSVVKPAAACGRSYSVSFQTYANRDGTPALGDVASGRLRTTDGSVRSNDLKHVPIGRATTLVFTASLVAPAKCTLTLELRDAKVHSLRWMT